MANALINDYLNIAAKTVSTPAIIRGSADLSTFPGVMLGALADDTARTINGTALQAALDWCAANNKFAELPPGRYEYLATGTHASRNVGLRVPRFVSLIGAGSAVNDGARLIQYASNHPALTLGSLTAGEYTEGATIKGLAVGHGSFQGSVKPATRASGSPTLTATVTANLAAGMTIVGVGIPAATTIVSVDSGTQITMSANASSSGTDNARFGGQDSAEGILIGEYWRSRFDDLLVNPLFVGTFHPTYGIRIGAGSGNHFFSNDVGTIVCFGAQVNLWRQDAGGTGSRFENVYLGGGTFGNRVATTSIPCYFNASGSDIGSFGQLNIEWCAPADFNAPLGFNNCDGADIAHLHLEGNRVGGFDGIMLANVSASKVNIGTIKVLDSWIATANVSGTPRVLATFGDCQIDIGQFYARWNGSGYSAEAVCTAALRMIHPSDASTVGVRRDIEARNIDLSGNTGAFHFDARLTGAAPGAAGAIYGARKFTYDEVHSRSEGATIEMRNADMILYAAHEKALVKVTQAITTPDKKLVLSNNMAASGIGNVPVRKPGDTIRVARTAAATGAFNVNVRDSADAVTVAAVAAASTGMMAVFDTTTAWDAS